MKAAQIAQFGPPSVITNNDLPQPVPCTGQLLVRVKAAGVGSCLAESVRSVAPPCSKDNTHLDKQARECPLHQHGAGKR